MPISASELALAGKGRPRAAETAELEPYSRSAVIDACYKPLCDWIAGLRLGLVFLLLFAAVPASAENTTRALKEFGLLGSWCVGSMSMTFSATTMTIVAGPPQGVRTIVREDILNAVKLTDEKIRLSFGPMTVTRGDVEIERRNEPWSTIVEMRNSKDEIGFSAWDLTAKRHNTATLVRCFAIAP